MRLLRDAEERFWKDPWWVRTIILWVLTAPTLGYLGTRILEPLIGPHPITLGLGLLIGPHPIILGMGLLTMAPLITCLVLMITREKTPEGNPIRNISPFHLLIATVQVCVMTTTIPVLGITILAGESPGTFMKIIATTSPLIALVLPSTIREIWVEERKATSSNAREAGE